MSRWKIYDEREFYFITYSVTEWYPVFTKSEYFDVLIDSLSYCRRNKGLKIHAYVIMLNHVHLIISRWESSPNSISDIIRDHKRYTSKRITQQLSDENQKLALSVFCKEKSEGTRDSFNVWQAGFHPVILLHEKMFIQKMEYIHNNPVKKGYVRKPEHWYYSSASYYEEKERGPLEVDNLFK